MTRDNESVDPSVLDHIDRAIRYGEEVLRRRDEQRDDGRASEDHSSTDDMGFDDLDREYEAKETQRKAVVLSIVQAVQELVTSTTNDDQALARCDQICEAIIASRSRGGPRDRLRLGHYGKSATRRCGQIREAAGAVRR